jgi:DNA-binding MarR family transcriptional regulator
MSESFDKKRPTSTLITASNVLQALNPSRLGLLVVIYDNDIQAQEEIANLIGRPQSTVSTYLQSLGSLTPSLAGKQGKYYTVTNTGKQIISLVNDMARRCDCKLRSIDWADETDRETVDALLTPLHDSQVIRPYLVLDSLYERSRVDGPIGTPQPVNFDDIVRDVESRQDDLEQNITTEEIRRTVKLRFNNTDAVRFEEGTVTLLHKGHQQAWLWNELIQYLKKQDRVSSRENEGAAITDTVSDDRNLDRFRNSTPISSRESEQADSSYSSSTHTASEKRHIDKRFTVEQKSVSDQPSIIPVYSLHSSTEADKGDSSSILPLTETMTIEELADEINQLATEYGEETELILEWMVQTDSGLYPLASTDSDISDPPEFQQRSPHQQ